MIIGTPFTKSSLRALLLGSGELGKELCISLQNLGIEVTAASAYPQAPAQQVSQKAITADLMDSDQLMKIIQQEQPHFIFPEIESIAYDVLDRVEKTGLSTVVPGARAIENTVHREKIRRLATDELGLITSASAFANSSEELALVINNKIGYPCIVKPITSSSGKGQSRINTPEEIEQAWRRAQHEARVDRGRVIVESFLEFDYEVTLLTVRTHRDDDSYHIDFCEPIGHIQVNGDYRESWQPFVMPAKALERAKNYASEIVNHLGGTGLFGVEFFVRGEEVWFSEISARPHDTGLVTLCTQYHSEFDLHIRAALGFAVDVRLREPGASHVILSPIHASEFVFDHLQDALQDPRVTLRLFGKPTAWPQRRMGAVLATGATTDEARFIARQAAQCINIRAIQN